MRGFTLIEILVVLVVAGIVIAAVSPNFVEDDRQTLKHSAERLAALLEQAQDEALVTGGALAWSTIEGGYRFWHLDNDHNWAPIGTDELFHDRLFDPGVDVRDLRIDGQPAKRGDRVVFSASGRSIPFDATLVLRAESIAISGDVLGHVKVSAADGT